MVFLADGQKQPTENRPETGRKPPANRAINLINQSINLRKKSLRRNQISSRLLRIFTINIRGKEKNAQRSKQSTRRSNAGMAQAIFWNALLLTLPLKSQTIDSHLIQRPGLTKTVSLMIQCYGSQSRKKAAQITQKWTTTCSSACANNSKTASATGARATQITIAISQN